MFIIRWILGRLILGFNFIFSPSSPKLSESEQAELNQKTQHLSLYQLPACPFCVKVRRAMKRQGIKIDIHDIKNEQNREALLSGGGKAKVPCLKIEEQDKPVTWLYESNDIIEHLKQYA
jgi:glutaredoxin